MNRSVYIQVETIMSNLLEPFLLFAYFCRKGRSFRSSRYVTLSSAYTWPSSDSRGERGHSHAALAVEESFVCGFSEQVSCCVTITESTVTLLACVSFEGFYLVLPLGAWLSQFREQGSSKAEDHKCMSYFLAEGRIAITDSIANKCSLGSV